MVGLIGVCLSGLGLVTSASAEDDPAGRPAYLPSLVIKGSSTGEGTIAVSVDYLIAGQNDRSLSIAPSLEVASQDGLATIATLGSDGLDGKASWRLGLEVTWRREQKLPSGTEAVGYHAAVLECLREESPDATFDQALDAELNPLNRGAVGTAGNQATPLGTRLAAAAQSIDWAKLCARGKQRAIEKAADQKRPLPTWQVAVGARGGQTALEFLRPADASPMALHKDGDDYFTLRAGASLVHFDPSSSLTIEGAVRFVQDRTPHSNKLRWCVPGPEVNDDSGQVVPSEQCQELPGAPPTRARTGSASIFLGRVTKDRYGRGAIGLFAELGEAGTVRPYRIALETPVYLQYASKDYSGLVRATPSAAYSRDRDGNRDWQVSLTIALLGQRNLFPGALD